MVWRYTIRPDIIGIGLHLPMNMSDYFCGNMSLLVCNSFSVDENLLKSSETKFDSCLGHFVLIKPSGFPSCLHRQY